MELEKRNLLLKNLLKSEGRYSENDKEFFLYNNFNHLSFYQVELAKLHQEVVKNINTLVYDSNFITQINDYLDGIFDEITVLGSKVIENRNLNWWSEEQSRHYVNFMSTIEYFHLKPKLENFVRQHQDILIDILNLLKNELKNIDDKNKAEIEEIMKTSKIALETPTMIASEEINRATNFTSFRLKEDIESGEFMLTLSFLFDNFLSLKGKRTQFLKQLTSLIKHNDGSDMSIDVFLDFMNYKPSRVNEKNLEFAYGEYAKVIELSKAIQLKIKHQLEVVRK